VVPNKAALDFLEKHTFGNLKALEDDTRNKLRQTLERGIINRDNLTELRANVKDVMKASEARANSIVQTELNRADNVGSLSVHRQLEFEFKTVSAVVDKNTSSICRALDGKTVGIDEKFEYKGEEWDSPPFHINCRSRLLYS